MVKSALLDHEILKISDHQKLELAEHCANAGREAFGGKNIEAAFHHFTDGIKFLILINPKTASAEITLRKKGMLTVLQNNAANCHLLKGNWEYVIDLLNDVLAAEPENVKGLFRRGTAYMEIQEYEKSASDLYAAQALEPSNGAVKGKLETLNQRLRNFNRKSSAAFKNMFR